MLTIRMKRDSTEPARIAGKLYVMEEKEARPLVEAGYADWEYVPESKVAELTSAEPATTTKESSFRRSRNSEAAETEK